ncbi:hypothetical protein EDB85DRAFT_2279616 [Lactarius pseudohatsudake]|nr:hypothetical protein EDB85DRAFT_2279616 [Lactarius pseudohatsudake]
MASRTSARTTLQRPALAFAPHGDYLSSQRRVALPPRRRTRRPASLLQPEPVTLYYHATSIHFRSVRLGFRSPRHEGQKGSALAGPATAPTPADALANTSLLAESYESLKAAENTECVKNGPPRPWPRFPIASVPRARVAKRVTAFLWGPAPMPGLVQVVGVILAVHWHSSDREVLMVVKSGFA